MSESTRLQPKHQRLALVVAALQHGVDHGRLAGAGGSGNHRQLPLSEEDFVGVEDVERAVQWCPAPNVLATPLV